MKLRILRSTLLLAALTLAAPAARAEDPCPEGRPRVADLGIGSLDCDCSFQSYGDARPRLWRFRGEPVVRSLRAGSPAAAVMREDDVITAIDGHLITTREGGRRFANLEVGRPVTLTFRRDDRVLNARLAPESVCADESMLGVAPMPPMPPMPHMEFFSPQPSTPAAPLAPSEPSTPSTPRAPRPPRAPRATLLPGWRWNGESPQVFEVVPRGWFGMSLNCSDCKSERSEGSGPVWTFTSLPEVAMVEPGSPAARGGLRAGDVLTHIDRIALNTAEGGRKFGAVRPGQNVVFTVQRGGTPQRIRVAAGARGEPRAKVEELLDRGEGLGEREVDGKRLSAEMKQLQAELAKLRARQLEQGKRLRYAGSVGGSDVEVRGLRNVVVDDSGDEIVIITNDARIVIKPSARSGDRKRK